MGWKRRHTRLLLFIIIVVGHLAKNQTSYYLDISLFSQQDSHSNIGANLPPLEVPRCTPEQLSRIKMQLPPEDCLQSRRKPWEQKCSLSYATRCPDAVWLEKYYTKLHSLQHDRSAPPFLGIFVGCNKGFDAVNALRMGSGNPLYDKDAWRRAMTDNGKKNLDRAVCSQATSAQFALQSDTMNQTTAESTTIKSGQEVSAYSSSQVHCIEPLPDTVIALQKAAWMTKYDKHGFVVTHAAMSSEDGTAEFARSRKNKAVGVENLGISTGCNKGHLTGCVNVTKYSLDTYVTKFLPGNDAPINYLSLDVEGWDADVLAGGYQNALARVQYLEFEYNWVGPWKDQSLFEVVEYLDENFGFTCYWAGFNNTIWRITNCWLNHYDIHSWSNVACVSRNFNEVREIAQDMEQLFVETLAKGLDAVRDFEHRYRHPEPKKYSKNGFASNAIAEGNGGILLKDLSKKYDKEIKSEMEARHMIEQLTKDYDELTLKEKWDALRLDETKRLKAAVGGMARIKITDVTSIKPLSKEMEMVADVINKSK